MGRTSDHAIRPHCLLLVFVVWEVSDVVDVRESVLAFYALDVGSSRSEHSFALVAFADVLSLSHVVIPCYVGAGRSNDLTVQQAQPSVNVTSVT